MGLHLGLAKGHEVKAIFTLWLQRIQVTFSKLILSNWSYKINLTLPSWWNQLWKCPHYCIFFSGNKISNLNIHIILMGFHLQGPNPVRLRHKAAKWHSQGCLWERRNNLAKLATCSGFLKAASRWQLCPIVGMMKAIRGFSPSGLKTKTREQLTVQSHVRFDFTVVAKKGHNTLLSNGRLYASKRKKLFELQNNVVTTSKGRNWLWNHVDWILEEEGIEIREQWHPREAFKGDRTGNLSAQRRRELNFWMGLWHQDS